MREALRPQNGRRGRNLGDCIFTSLLGNDVTLFPCLYLRITEGNVRENIDSWTPSLENQIQVVWGQV